MRWQRRQWHPTPVLLPGKSHGQRTWWAAVYGVAQSRTWLKRRSSSSSRCIEWYIKKQSYYYPFTKIPSAPYWAFENISFMNLLYTLDRTGKGQFSFQSWRPTRLPRPWDSPGKSTGVGHHCLLWIPKKGNAKECPNYCTIALISHTSSVQFSSGAQSCPAAGQTSLSITNSRSSPKPMSIESVMPSSHLILCRPLLLLPSIFPSIRVF